MTAGVCLGLLVGAAAAGPAAAAPTFEGAANYTDDITFSNQHRAVAAGELTGGGRPEVVMVGNSVGVLRFTGNTADPTRTIRVGSEPAQDIYTDPIATYEDVAIGSLSGDGRPDFVAVGSDGVRRFVQAATGGFDPDPDPDGAWLAGTPLTAVAVGRVNGDSLADIVAVGPTGGWVIRQQAGGAFADPLRFAEGNLRDVVIRDFSGDGRFDLGVAGTVTGRGAGVHVLVQSPTTFAFAPTAASPIVTGSVEAIVVARLDAGTTADLAASRSSDDQVVIRLGDGRGAFRSGPSRVSPGVNPGALAVADLDGDGLPDLVVATLDRAVDPTDIRNVASVMSGAGTGAFSRTGTIEVWRAGQLDDEGNDVQDGNDVRSLAVADVTDDGKPDVLFADNALSAAIVARNNSITLPPPPPDPPDPTDPNPPDPDPGDQTGPTGPRDPRVDGVVPEAGRAGPGLAVSGRPKASLRRIAIAASCTAACRITARGRISLHPRARKKLRLGTVTKALGPGGSILLELTIPRRGRPALTRAIRRGSPVRARVVITAEDAQGTRATETLVIALGPRRPGRG